MILQQVTIAAHRVRMPTIGAPAGIRAGGKRLGGVRIAPRTRIGAYALVLCDGAGCATAVGVPALLPRPRTAVAARAAASSEGKR